MKKFTWAIIIVCLLSAVLFLIYGLEVKPVESLIRPPEYSDEGGSVQLALEAEIGKIYFLKTPTQGENRSAFIYHDFDGDAKKEALVLYSELQNPDSVTVSIFRQSENSWKRITSVSCPYEEVMQVDFADINGNGIDDIIIGYSIYGGEITQHLFVYSVNSLNSADPSITVRYDSAYSKYSVIDVDTDGRYDLFVLNPADSERKFGYKAGVISFSEKEWETKAAIELDSALRSASDINADISDNMARIYIDGYTADGKMVTDMVSWNYRKKNLQRFVFRGKSMTSLTTRTKTAVCADINSDGVIEIPTDYVLPASKALGGASAKKISLLCFVCVTDGKLAKTEYYFENAGNGYYYKIGKNQIGSFTIVTSLDATSAKFYSVKQSDDGKTVADKLLFEIRTVTDLETGRAPQTYKSIGQNKGFYYYCRIYNQGEADGLTISDIRKNMIFDLKGSTK